MTSLERKSPTLYHHSKCTTSNYKLRLILDTVVLGLHRLSGYIDRTFLYIILLAALVCCHFSFFYDVYNIIKSN